MHVLVNVFGFQWLKYKNIGCLEYSEGQIDIIIQNHHITIFLISKHQIEE